MSVRVGKLSKRPRLDSSHYRYTLMDQPTFSLEPDEPWTKKQKKFST